MTMHKMFFADKTYCRKVCVAVFAMSTFAFSYGAEISLQTDSAAYHRITESKLVLPIDWTWEWLPADVQTATVTLTGMRSGLLNSISVSDHLCNQVEIQDFGGSWDGRYDEAITVELAFSNASGDIARKTYVYEYVSNSAATPLHEGTPMSASWRREVKSLFAVPFDSAWFDRCLERMTLALTDESGNTSRFSIEASAGRFAFRKLSLASGIYHLELLDAEEVLSACDVELIPPGLLLSIK